MTTSRTLRSAAGGLLALALGVMAWTAPVGTASAASRPSAAKQVAAPRYKYSRSSVAWTGSRAVIAATDAHGDLYYFWLTGTTWHSQEVAKGKRGVAYSKPAIAWTGHTVVIVALTESGGLVYFARHTSNSGWSSRVLSQVARHRYQAPSVAGIPGGGVLVSAANSAGELMSFELAPGTSRWKTARLADGTFSPPSVTVGFNSMTLADLGLITATSGGTLFFWWEPLAKPGWTQETIASLGPGSSYTGASIAVTPADVLVTAAATTGAVDVWAQEIGSPGWSSPQAVVAGGGSRYPTPAIAWTGPTSGGTSYDVITATNSRGELDYWWEADGDTDEWYPQEIAAAGAQSAYARPSITVSATSVIITAVNTKTGAVWYWHQAFQTNGWQKLRVARG
jgi:hypothetical protein